MTSVDLTRYALAAAARGWHVFPLAADDKVPPKGRSWKQVTTTDPATIRRYWSRGCFNVGIATGPSELVVIDLDVPKPGQRPPPAWTLPGVTDGADVLAVLCERTEQPFPSDTFMVRTRRGGWHLYFEAPANTPLGNTSGEKGAGLGWLIDTRADGGYVVGPGSHVDLPDGAGSYDVIHNPPPAPLPAWLAERLQQPPRGASPPVEPPALTSQVARLSEYVRSALAGEVQHVLDAAEGTRNHTLNEAAFRLGRRFVHTRALPADLAEQALTQAGQSAGLGERECAATVRSGLEAAARPGALA